MLERLIPLMFCNSTWTELIKQTLKNIDDGSLPAELFLPVHSASGDDASSDEPNGRAAHGGRLLRQFKLLKVRVVDNLQPLLITRNVLFSTSTVRTVRVVHCCR